jgi:type I restriction enzyme S subunit
MKPGWQETPFEDCIENVSYTLKVLRKDFLDEGAFPVISQEAEFINGYWDNEADLFKVSKPIVLFGDHTKVFKYVDFDFVLGADGVKILQPKEFLSPKFFFYQLQAKDLDSLGYARHYKLLKALKIAYPDLPEQQRIVRLLDEAFAAIATAKANAEKNLVNAKGLFASASQEMYESAGKDWEEKKLGDLASEMQTGPFGSTLHKSDYVTNGIPVINPQNIVDGKIIPLQKMMVNEKTKQRLKRYILQEKDIVIARRGEMGRCAIVEKRQVGWLCGSGSFVIRIKKEVDANFLVRYLSSAKVRHILLKGSVGATMDNLNQGILAQIPVPFPPLVEQRAIVGQLDLLRLETHRLESIYQRKLAVLDELKKSLLHQAFDGEL